MGIIVDVLRSHHDPDSWLGDVDCTNGGITNHKNGVHKLTIINAGRYVRRQLRSDQR